MILVTALQRPLRWLDARVRSRRASRSGRDDYGDRPHIASDADRLEATLRSQSNGGLGGL